MDRKSLKPIRYSFCHSPFVYNNFQNYKGKFLVIDSRDPESFGKYSVCGSVNLNHDRIKRHYQPESTRSSHLDQMNIESISQILNATEASIFEERKRRFCVIMISETPIMREFINETKALAQADENADCYDIPETVVNDTLRALLDSIREENSVALGFEIFRMLKKDRVQEAHILIDSASEFFAHYPLMNQALCTSMNMTLNSSLISNIQKQFDFPNDILDGRLFLGNFTHSKKHEVLVGLKISHIVNCAYECENYYEDKGIKYLKLWVKDEMDDHISKCFQEAYKFINEALSESDENKVFVHCARGKSRSAAIITMYLMKKFSWTFRRAFEYVKSKRSLVNPNSGFQQELEDLEKNSFNFRDMTQPKQNATS